VLFATEPFQFVLDNAHLNPGFTARLSWRLDRASLSNVCRSTLAP
jgi:hypothetical protein